VFTTLLIANRGEIACRVAATARRLGLRTVAVYSDADANARHVAACDRAVHIGGSEPRASYLRTSAILDAARATGAQAIHPGYGFLSENAAFADACAQEGIIFVGPPAGALAAMGSKSAAKTLMEKAAVPLVPGYHGDNQDPAFLRAQADSIGYPVLIKASLGGGGKGMRIVQSGKAFDEALRSCQREAASSFGDDKVLVERYLQKPRHIEIQIFADTQGHCVYLFERDCSVQRRHQKIVEEAPAPAMTAERRRAMGESAVAAAQAVNYVGAGTVEFIVEPGGRFYFMEMNTRIQVEHPVTEMITGLDLVEWQLRVAAGESLPATQKDLTLNGHAFEARIYAENPDNGFLPSIGTLSVLNFPPHAAFQNGAVRIDGGVRQGDAISPFYDPMIAKLITRGHDRDQARARMIQALSEIQIVGVQTNIAFLRRLMTDPAFARADLDTGLIEQEREHLFPGRQNAGDSVLALVAAAILTRQGVINSSAGRTSGGHTVTHVDPWAETDGWRIGGVYRQPLTLIDNGVKHEIVLERRGAQWAYAHEAAAQTFEWSTETTTPERTVLRIRLDGVDTTGVVILRDRAAHVFVDGAALTLQIHDPVNQAQDESNEHQGGLAAPMPGKIIAISVKAGDQVKTGDVLLVMEAMKMEHTVYAPRDGIVEELFFTVGDQVSDGVELIALSSGGPA
jgi:3-methylcrotonyl-CoA carboxylase alpha subunit